ncbi:SIR2 family NAD-dependent protein deacylase [Salsuginibacillus kocurii]|uniref:SIR2 family NAD-dependent protein deacylase n=1 Tax=Salsuginibacillus kocurii TaxID=427078 RepID=UPI000366A930|nr:NAD-dependent deacylase [Salsuginibacillus kocurii]
MNANARQVATYLQKSKCTVILTGAGMSTESGIPDFRSENGLWHGRDPMTIATPEALETDYETFFNFYLARLEALDEASPHKGHQILAKWEENGFTHHVATQNVDGFHRQAGQQHISELHGSIQAIRCHDCNMKASDEKFRSKGACSACGGRLRPDIVLFGEMLPQQEWERSIEMISEAELVLVIGTSLQVAPVSQLPNLTPGQKVWINQEAPEREEWFDLTIQGKAGEILTEIDQMLSQPES